MSALGLIYDHNSAKVTLAEDSVKVYGLLKGQGLNLQVDMA